MIRPRLSRRVALVALALVALTAALWIAESAGANVRFAWRLGGDLRRESRFVEQYGQVVSSVIIVLLIWQLDPPRRRVLPAFAAALLLTLGVATAGKRLIGRERLGAAAV